MRIEKRDGSQERRILIGMIVDTTVLGRIDSKWEDDLFSSRWANLIAKWCIKYFRKYQKAPKKAIEGLFETWAQEARDKETVQLVEKFLDGLSGEYTHLSKESNSDYLIDLAAVHFNKVRLSRLAEAIQGDLDSGDIDKAHKKVAKFDQIEMGVGAGVNVLSDEAAITAAFRARNERLLTYPAALGNFFGDALERDGFIAFMGPEKRGKTFWLLDLAWRAMMQGRKVAFFEVGDLSQNQMILRFMGRASKKPIRLKEGEKIYWPTRIDVESNEKMASVERDEYEFKKVLSLREALKEAKRYGKKYGPDGLKLSCHPSSTLSVAGIQSVLKTWERGGWVPDVIVVDYADILAPPYGFTESRDQINATWKQLRSLSQSMHCLVVTATQSDAASYRADILDQANFSEDKRKLAHVTGMVGINATKAEKELGIQRLNWIVLREAAFEIDRVCHVAGCMALANPAVKSSF